MLRGHEIKQGHALTHVRTMDGIDDLIRIADRRIAEGVDNLGNASLSGEEYFTGTRTLAEAVGLARYGWHEGMDRINQIAESINIDPSILQSALRVESSFDVSGDEPDIDRFLQGSPDNMVTYSNSDEARVGRVLDFVINVAQHASVDKQEIENRGAAILASVEALKANGYSIGVFAVEQCEPSGSVHDNKFIRYEIPILEPGQSVNIDTLAFSIMHPSFLRRLIFAANENEPKEIREEFGFRSGGGYGRPVYIDGYQHARPAMVIDKDEGLHRSSEDTARFAQKLVEKSLAELGAETTS